MYKLESARTYKQKAYKTQTSREKRLNKKRQLIGQHKYKKRQLIGQHKYIDITHANNLSGGKESTLA